MIKIKRDKVVLNLGETHREKSEAWTGCYSHIVGDKIYYRLDNPAEICYAVKEGTEYKKPPENTILKNSLAIQNFRAFLDTNPQAPDDEKYKAIGGFHVGKSHAVVNGCEISKKASVFNVPCPVWPKEERLLFGDDFHHPRHANGFYIFKSKNGIEWELYCEKPVLSALTVCEDNILASDAMPSIFYDVNINEYVAYLRGNVKLGVRHVFYTKSKDLIKWDAPKLITKTPEFDFTSENLYYMGAYPLLSSNKYISFTHYFKNDILSADGSNRRYYDKKTLVMISKDGVHWEVVGNIFPQDQESVRESGERGCIRSMVTHLGPPHVVSFEEESEVLVLYVLEGIWTSDTKIVKYTMSKKELGSYIL